MIWITWRQHRIHAVVAVSLTILTALLLWKTGMNLRLIYQHEGYNGIQSQSTLIFIIERLCSVAFPLVLGVFVGAPLIPHEIEEGTHRFIWTQSITRYRWFLSTAGILICSTIVVSIILNEILLWWESLLEANLGMWQTYNIQLSVLMPYALFALALGIFLGTVLRKTVPSMALTLVLFLIVQLGIEFIVRPHFLPSLVSTENHRISYSYSLQNYI